MAESQAKASAAKPNAAAYVLSPQARSLLKRPFGLLFCEPQAAKKAAAFISTLSPAAIVVVGDATFSSMKKTGVFADLAIVDGRTLRKKTGLPAGLPKKRFRVRNAAGTISVALVKAVSAASAAFSKSPVPLAIIVDGEEDLAVLPAVLSLPFNSVVLYGQPKKGIVAVVVDEKTRARARAVLSKFK